jgi:putative FmdB family regulatory protein
MPFYDLRCASCGEEFNIRATVTQREQQQITCPVCNTHNLLPLFKAAHFSVKTTAAPACPNSHICGTGCHHMH